MGQPLPVGEFGLIDRIRRRAPKGGRTSLGIGDDCAALEVTAGVELLVTTDMLMEGSHFRLDQATPAEVGYKSLAVSLSDVAAMAGVPRAAVVAVALRRDRATELAQGFLDGMLPLAGRFGVDLIGGDTNAWDGPFVVSVTLLGEATPRGAVRRAGARPGDLVYVTGPLGGSLLGRHLRPEPRVAEALALHEVADLHAMIDLSDGLSSDLRHILDESGGLGATLDAGAIPIHADAVAMSARDGRPALDHALHDGEDFELCLVVDPSAAARLDAQPVSSIRLRRIGAIEAEPGLRLRSGDGQVRPLAPGGFDHLRSDRDPAR
jgi:thiamine-monophosphate kinase